MSGSCCPGGGGCSCGPRRPGSGAPARGPLLDFFPRFTTLVTSMTGGTYTSESFDVLGYKTITVEVAHVESTHVGGVLQTWLETSNDLKEWTKLGGYINPPTHGVICVPVPDPARYVRLVIDESEAMDMVKVVWARGVARRS